MQNIIFVGINAINCINILKCTSKIYINICTYIHILQLNRTKFHKSHHFEKIDGVYYLSEKADTTVHSRYSSTYPRGEAQQIPPWLEYDGQV